jgi:hypothetical protein
MIAIGTVTAYWIVSCLQAHTVFNPDRRATRILAFRSLIVPSLGGFLLASKSFLPS